MKINDYIKNKKLPDIPQSWLIAITLTGLFILKAFNFDGIVTAGIGVIIGYLTKEEVIKLEEKKEKE